MFILAHLSRRTCYAPRLRFLLLLLFAGSVNPAISPADITVTPLDGKVRVEIDGKLFTEYCYGDYSKPILYPIIGPHGIGMTRNYPMQQNVPGEAHDHPHQKSLWFTHGAVNGVDFWGEGPQSGKIVQDQLVSTSSGPGRGQIETTNRWLNPSGDVVLTDTRELTFWTSPQARGLDWKITLHASHGDVLFGDTKEGTMGLRMHPHLELRRNEKLGADAAVGHAMNSEAVKDQDIWGKRAKWVDYWGQIDGHTVGVAIFDHPRNPRHPTWWHARDYGLVAANPFGIHDFEGKPEPTGDLRIPAGQNLTLRYRFVFHEGDANEAKIAELYRQYAAAGEARALPPGQLPNDVRLGPLKDLGGSFPFSPPASADDWARRADQVRRRILVATGLWPLPEPRPVHAVVHGRIERDQYTVEKVYLESYPGHFVTGNLYRPKGTTGPRPAVLCPHGHFAAGRFQDHGLAEVRKQIVEGAERFEVGGRHLIQARCVQLARMGCIVFQYDMVGYADSQQIAADVAHGHSSARPEFETRQDWGFYSTQAELRLQSIMGLQTYNSLCALDWIANLPEVDPDRIAVTGASGGGTQTMILCAIDPRPAVSFPAVMVSTAMQGGCTCENACCLRVDTGNVEFAALFAPKPLGMTAADDWTREIATKGLPELKQLYAMLGAADHVMAKPLIHFPHNYNYVSRAVMYSWMNKHLGLGWEEPVVEEDYQPLTHEDMSVWNREHPQPLSGAEHERALVRAITEQSDGQLAALRPHNQASLAQFRDVVGGALEVLVDRQLPPPGSIERTKVEKRDCGDYFQFHDLVRLAKAGEELPTVFLLPKKWLGNVVIWVDGQGKQCLFDDNGMPCPEARRLMDAGVAVASADLAYQGEFLVDGEPLAQLRTVGNSRDYAGYTFGYNPTLFAQRVHDILTLVSFVRHDEHAPQRVHLIGVRGAGPWVAAARALMGDEVDATAIDTGGFRFTNLASWRDVNFLPGAVKYGDLPAMLALCAPHKMWIAGETQSAPDLAVPAAAYDAAAAQDNITFARSQPDAVIQDAVTWLLANPRG